MELRGQLRASTGGRLQAVTVLSVSEAGCLIEATRTLELGEHVIVELEAGAARSTVRGIVSASNELQLVYNIRFESGAAPSPELLASVRGGR